MKDKYLKSTAPGMAWRVGTHKPQGRPAYAFATEGEVAYIDERVMSFTTQWPGARTERVEIVGPATEKKKAAALAEIEARLQAAGVLA